MFDNPVSRAALRHIYENADPKVISKALERGRVDSGHQGKATELTRQQEAEIIRWIEEKSVRKSA
jgi:hypothetical protein